MEKYNELLKNINDNYKEIKNILTVNHNKIQTSIFLNTYPIVFDFFKNSSSLNNIKYSIEIIQFYLKYITHDDFNKLNTEIFYKSEQNINNKNINSYLRSFLIKCKKARINKSNGTQVKLNDNKLNNTMNLSKRSGDKELFSGEQSSKENITNYKSNNITENKSNNITDNKLNNIIDNKVKEISIDNKIKNIINIMEHDNNFKKMIISIKKLSIYLDRITAIDILPKIFFEDIINKINITFKKISEMNLLNKEDNILEYLLTIINKCKKIGNISKNELETILYKCDNNIYDYVYILNLKHTENKESEENAKENKMNLLKRSEDKELFSETQVKENTIDFITKLGFIKKDFEDIDNLSLKRGFIFGLTKDNKDYILKYQPNKSTVELLINCYLKSLNINNFLIPNAFFINNDNSYFYIIEKYHTDLYKYFNILDEKKIILSFKELLNIIYFIIKSVIELHKNNIIHSDLKLENIILNVDENNKYKDLKIIDFDVGVFSTIPNTLNNLPDRYNKILNNKKPRGTRIYMLKDTEMSFKNDIFSLGVIAIVLLYKNTKLLLSYRKSVDSKNIIKKLTTFRTNIENNKAKIDMINVIERYLKKEHKKENNKSVFKKTNFIDINIINSKVNNEQYNENLSFYRNNDIDKFKIFKNFIDDCINNRLDIHQINDKYEKILFS
jgi:hypothetical protein